MTWKHAFTDLYQDELNKAKSKTDDYFNVIEFFDDLYEPEQYIPETVQTKQKVSTMSTKRRRFDYPTVNDETTGHKTLTTTSTKHCGKYVGDSPYHKVAKKYGKQFNNLNLRDKNLFVSPMIHCAGKADEEASPYRRNLNRIIAKACNLNFWIVPKDYDPVPAKTWRNPIAVRMAIVVEEGGGAPTGDDWFKYDGLGTVDPETHSEIFPQNSDHFQYGRALDTKDRRVLWEKTMVINPPWDVNHYTQAQYRQVQKYIPINRVVEFDNDTIDTPTENMYLCFWYWKLGHLGSAQYFTSTDIPFDFHWNITTYWDYTKGSKS